MWRTRAGECAGLQDKSAEVSKRSVCRTQEEYVRNREWALAGKRGCARVVCRTLDGGSQEEVWDRGLESGDHHMCRFEIHSLRLSERILQMSYRYQRMEFKSYSRFQPWKSGGRVEVVHPEVQVLWSPSLEPWGSCNINIMVEAWEN
jgi:hypothetical protein